MTLTEQFTERFGRFGIWSLGLRDEEPGRTDEVREAAAELDALGYGAVWIGGSPSLRHAATLLESTSRITVGTSILSIWDHPATEVAAEHADLSSAHDGRLLLGLGVSHAPFPQRQAHPLANRPFTALRAYLDALDTAPAPVPVAQRALAALGPQMLRVAAERSLGALPYLGTVEHTAQARATLGPDAFLAPELKVIPDPDPARGRAIARTYLGTYLALTNYLNSWRRLGFTDQDFANGGSDRLIDAVFAIGEPEAIRARAERFLDAGADHIALQVVTAGPRTALPRAEWRQLASALPLSPSSRSTH
ncbi:LLM class F420-dependent oxidoreductase [Streptomyces sp. NPDC003077]|uniref:LLM class F420-dependent oxidoreductase n=1 Tax=Streptomyces sp. NPDC003077 TaxID=3154443 RepID=UPI0033A054CB